MGEEGKEKGGEEKEEGGRGGRVKVVRRREIAEPQQIVFVFLSHSKSSILPLGIRNPTTITGYLLQNL